MSIKVMIVDDSPFSRTLLAESLQQEGCKIVGEASGMEGLIETYNQCKPDIVTMDLAMPGADGFQCSRALLTHDSKAKIILVSSMKDEEKEVFARRIGIVGYLQKPIEADALKRAIENIMSPDALYNDLKSYGMESFQEALVQTIRRMAKTEVSITKFELTGKNISRGITAVIGIIGRYPGTMIIDFSQETAEKMAEVMLRRQVTGKQEVVAMAAELANVVGGIACSILNKHNKAFGFRVSPPSVFNGTKTEIANPSLQLQAMMADSEFGQLCLWVGFKKGSV